MRRDIVVTALLTFCLTATLFMVATSRSQEYDPWANLNEDGIIDIFDVVGVTGIYETTGDTTKNVNVMNWPISAQTTVFWQQSSGLYSPLYNASGFGHVHVLWDVSGLTGSENVTIRGYSEIHDPSGGGWYTTHFTIVFVTTDNKEGSTSFPVPAESFGFHLAFGSGTTASVNFAFYLTYA